MLRCSVRRLCVTAAGTAAGAGSAKMFSFQAKMDRIKADSDSDTWRTEYTFMRDRLNEYAALQNAYAVKQTDVERAKRAAHMCGLEFTEKKAPGS